MTTRSIVMASIALYHTIVIPGTVWRSPDACTRPHRHRPRQYTRLRLPSRRGPMVLSKMRQQRQQALDQRQRSQMQTDQISIQRQNETQRGQERLRRN